MSHQTGHRSGYTVEYQNRDKIWKPFHINELTKDGNGIALAHWEHDTWINAMLRVMSYEAAVAVIAVAKANAFEKAMIVKFRIRRWDVTYDLKAVETEDTAEFVNDLFKENHD
jgi:hypothetical protein